MAALPTATLPQPTLADILLDVDAFCAKLGDVKLLLVCGVCAVQAGTLALHSATRPFPS